MFFLLSKILDIALSPLTWGLTLIALSLIRKFSKHAKRLVFSGIAMICFFAIEPVDDALWLLLESGTPNTMREGVVYDMVVVLGGIIDDDATAAHGDVAFSDTSERLLVPFEMLREGRARRILLTGGDGRPLHEGQPEADTLAAQLRQWGIESDRILIEDQSRNTHENAVFSARVLAKEKPASVLLVTSAFHMRRALGCFRKEGLVVDARPVDFHTSGHLGWSLFPRTIHLESSTRAIHEMVGRVIYRLRGYSAPVD